MTENIEIWLPDAVSMQTAGESLSRSLYGIPVNILLTGELGAGKTTFLQGFGRGLGLQSALRSPTFALEQRVHAPDGRELHHLDLFRLTPQQAVAFLRDHHEGSFDIRCIEWADRLGANKPGNAIAISITGEGDSRKLHIDFQDVPLPSADDVHAWRVEAGLPQHIIDHCEAVTRFAQRLGKVLLDRGGILRPLLLQRSGELHDLFRYVDFRTQPASIPPVWDVWRKRYEGQRHEAACAAFLRERGHDALAQVIEVHGLTLPSPPRVTIEQQLLFYADKRVCMDKVVSLRERFDDFNQRYANGEESEKSRTWYAEAQLVERALFPGGSVSW